MSHDETKTYKALYVEERARRWKAEEKLRQLRDALRAIMGDDD